MFGGIVIMYCNHTTPCEYASVYPTVSGTDSRIRKEMDDYFAQERENKNNCQDESLFKKVINYIFA